MKRGFTFKIPNQLLLDGALNAYTRRIGILLFSRINAHSSCCKSLEELARLSDCCVETVKGALTKLENLGYIHRQKRLRYHAGQGRMVHSKTQYTCNTRLLSDGYTLLPRSIFQFKLTARAFLMLSYFHYQSGSKGRAFPGLSLIAKDLNMAHSTVCMGLNDLKAASVIYVQHCINANGSFNFNSYFFLNHTPAHDSENGDMESKDISCTLCCQTTGAAMRRPMPLNTRPCARQRAVERLGKLLFNRYSNPAMCLCAAPYISISPVPRRWKPPFLWG